MGPLTLLTVPGRDDVDVLLCLGERRRPAGKVLAHAVVAGGHHGLYRGEELRTRPLARRAPGLRVRKVPAFDPRTTLKATTTRFDLTAEHDLLDRPALFGLRAVSAPDRRNHFPGISRWPLGVDQARQDVAVTFSAEGFRAAAVTVMSAQPLGALMAEAHILDVAFDRPFGFLARHRPSGLILLAGWVADPQTRRDVQAASS